MVNPLTLPPIPEDRRPKRRRRNRLFELFRGRSVRQARDDREAGLWDWLKKNGYTAGALWKYAQLVGPAVDGAVTHPGAKKESHTFVDI